MGLFNLIFTLGVNRKPLQDGLSNAKKDVSGFGSEVKGMLARTFAIGAMAVYAKTILDTAGKISDLSSRLGVSTDAIQQMDYAAKQNGATVENFTTALQRLAVARKAALSDPQGSEAKAFEKFNIGVAQLKNSRLEDILSMIASSMQAMGDSQLFTADALELMGRSAGDLFPTLINGFEDVKKKAMELGQVMSADAIASLDTWGDKFSSTLVKIKVLAGEIVSPLAEMHNRLGTIIDALITTAKAPFVESGWMEMRAAWEGQHVRDPDLPLMFDPNAPNGLNGGRAVAGQGEWQGPQLPAGWGEPITGGGGGRNSFRRTPSDSLVSVGNFLGADPTSSMRAQINQIQQRLMRIEQNTKRTADNAIIIRK